MFEFSNNKLLKRIFDSTNLPVILYLFSIIQAPFIYSQTALKIISVRGAILSFYKRECKRHVFKIKRTEDVIKKKYIAKKVNIHYLG